MHKFPFAKLLFVASCACVVFPSQAAKYTQIFEPQRLDLDITVTQPVMSANILPQHGVELIVAGIDDQQQRVLAIFALDPENNEYKQQDVLPIGRDIFAFDIGGVKSDLSQSLYFLSKTAVSRYIPAHMSHLSRVVEDEKVSSVFLSDIADSFIHKDFIRDLNDDGLDDIVLASFEHLNLWLSDCCGLRHPLQLPISSRLEIEDDKVSFHDRELFFIDMTLDNKTDLVLVEQGKINIFSQNENMQFSPVPQVIPVSQSISGLNWWETKGPNDRELDQSNLKHRTVKEIEDLNGDGLPDLAVQFTQSSGVLDKKIEFEFYYGQQQEQMLSFAETPDTSVKWDETLSDLTFMDLQMDGTQEVFVSSFDLGISQIIGALVSGSIDQDVLLFSMDENGKFAEKPLVSQEVEMTFSLSKGAAGEPLTKIVDINGDGIKDIVFSDGDDSIRVLLATPEAKRPFAKRSLRQKMTMPQNASSIEVADFNQDGKSDLVLHYGKMDPPELQKQIRVLLAR